MLRLQLNHFCSVVTLWKLLAHMKCHYSTTPFSKLCQQFETQSPQIRVIFGCWSEHNRTHSAAVVCTWLQTWKWIFLTHKLCGDRPTLQVFFGWQMPNYGDANEMLNWRSLAAVMKLLLMFLCHTKLMCSKYESRTKYSKSFHLVLLAIDGTSEWGTKRISKVYQHLNIKIIIDI